MIARRALLGSLAAVAVGGATRTKRYDGLQYGNAIVIDGMSSFGSLDISNPSSVEAQLSSYRDSGLTAIHLTVGAAGNTPERYQETLRRITNYTKLIQAYPGHLLHIRNSGDFLETKSSKRLGVIFGFQDAVPLDSEIERLDLFKNLGVRIFQLTYNRRNLVGDGCLERANAGLSEFGREVVAGLNERNLLIDGSHAGSRTMAETIALSTAPIIISHTGCRALNDVPRNTSDSELRAMAEKGGVVGIYFMPFLRPSGQPRALDVINHLEHAVNVAGEDHVALGTDGAIEGSVIDADYIADHRLNFKRRRELAVASPGEAVDVYNLVPDYNEPTRFYKLANDLTARAWRSRQIDKVLGQNFARVCKEVW